MENQSNHKTLKSYILGFVLSIVLTLIPFYFVYQHVISKHENYSHQFLIWLSFVAAMLQLLVQLFFFLHLGREPKPRWKLGVLISFVGIILIIVIGSLWIMQHLNYNMGPQVLDKMIQQGEGF